MSFTLLRSRFSVRVQVRTTGNRERKTNVNTN